MLRAEQFGLKREVEYGTPEQNETVKQIVEAVRTEGMRRCCGIRSSIDRVKLDAGSLRVTDEEIQAAYDARRRCFLDGDPRGGCEHS